MSRTFREIEMEGKKANVLFDTGSMRSYVRKEFLPISDGKQSHLK